MISQDMQQKAKDLLPDKDILTKYPVWSEVEGYFGAELKTPYTKPLTYDKVVMFVVASYHPKSPLSHIDNYIKKRYEAAKLAEFELDENGIFVHLNVVLAKDIFIYKCILVYLRLFKNPIFERAMIFRDELNKELESLNILVEPNARLQAEARKTILQNITVLTKNLEECELEFMQQDNSRDLMMSFFEDLEISTLGIEPEEIALNLKEGRPPLGNHNPYERK